MMKKITNNVKWGNITILFNLLLFISFFLSMFYLMKFDAVNRELVDIRPHYESETMKVQEAKQPLRKDSATVAFYSHKLDSLVAKPTPKNRSDANDLKSEIKRVAEVLEKEKSNKARTDSIIQVSEIAYAPIKAEFTEISTTTAQKRATFVLLLYINIALLLCKILLFAFWNYKNSKNLHFAAQWMKDGNAPYWSFVSWIVPVYNLIKPYTFFSEIVNETVYILNEKGVLSKKKNTDHEFYLGIWWTFFLLASIICSLVLYASFFAEGPMYWKLNHLSVATFSTIIWGIYLLIEILLIVTFNKYNKLLIKKDN